MEETLNKIKKILEEDGFKLIPMTTILNGQVIQEIKLIPHKYETKQDKTN